MYVQAMVLVPITLLIGLGEVECELRASNSSNGKNGGDLRETHVCCCSVGKECGLDNERNKVRTEMKIVDLM